MMFPELRKCQIRIPREILGRNSGLTFILDQKFEYYVIGGHVMVPELRKYQIRIPREILDKIDYLILLWLKVSKKRSRDFRRSRDLMTSS